MGHSLTASPCNPGKSSCPVWRLSSEGRRRAELRPKAALFGSGSGPEALLHRGRTEKTADTMETPSAPPSRMGDTWQGLLLSGKGMIPWE
jgi:hypothetical protein